MRTKDQLVLFVCFALVALLYSCDVQETLSTALQSYRTRQKENPTDPADAAPAGTATLEPPYEGWNWSKEKTRMSVANAVWSITQQVGIPYNADKSYENTGETCCQWTSPNFKSKPWEEAVSDVLAPENLTYVVENGQVVLMTVEDAQKREQEIEQLKSETAEFLAAPEFRRLHDGVVILPLVDAGGRTSELGTLLAELGMLKATYVPEKILNLHFPDIITLYDNYRFNRPGRTVTVAEQEQIVARLECKNLAAGTITREEDNRFRIELEFQGQHGTKTFSASAFEEELHTVPRWIAQCIHDYCQITLSPSQERYVDSLEIVDTANLLRLAALERDYGNLKQDPAAWRRFLKKNPASVFALYRLSLMQSVLEPDTFLSTILQRHRGHDLLRWAEATAYYRGEDYAYSARHLFRLLRRDYRNLDAYDFLDTSLLALGMGEAAEAIHTLWENHEQDSHLPLLARGDFYISHAWNARRHEWSYTVTGEGRQKFQERLHLAEQVLQKAYEMEPADPRIATNFIIIARGLSYERDRMEQWFDRAVQADPRFSAAYDEKFQYLKRKWHGDPEGKEMFAFARDCATHAPEDSRIGFLLMQAHSEMSRRWANRHQRNWREYYRDPEVYREVKAFYTNYLRENPDSMHDRNDFAKIALAAGDYREAVRQFKLIGTYIDTSCWSEKQFYLFRKKAYEEAGLL